MRTLSATMVHKMAAKPCGSPRAPACCKPLRVANCRSRGTQVIKAFREAEISHRIDRLDGLAQEFVHHWVRGSREGATAQVMEALCPIMHSDIKIKTTHLAGSTEAQGLDGVRDKLTLDQRREGTMRPSKTVMCAANEVDDSVFCLLEFEEVPPAGKEVKAEHKAYGIVKFDTLLDDTACMVTGVTERCQMGPADEAMLALHLPEEVAKDERARAEAVHETLRLAGTMHFPMEHIRELKGETIDAEAAKRSIELWCKARCSGTDEDRLMDQALDAESFRLWDAYGVLPFVCGIKRDSATSPAKCVMGTGAVLDTIKAAKAKYHIECTLLDSAICKSHNVGFAHWRSCVRPFEHPGPDFLMEGDQIVVEAMEMHVFNGDGKIIDTWMLRDPMPEEKKMMMETVAVSK